MSGWMGGCRVYVCAFVNGPVQAWRVLRGGCCVRDAICRGWVDGVRQMGMMMVVLNRHRMCQMILHMSPQKGRNEKEKREGEEKTKQKKGSEEKD